MPKVCYYKPVRQFPRRYSAADAGRIVRYAKEAGYTDAQICESIEKNGGLRCGTCDCVKLKVLLGLVLGAIALAVAISMRNKSAAKQAQEAIQRALDSSRQSMGRIELEKIEANMVLIQDSEDEMQEHLDKLNEELVKSMRESFSQEESTTDEGEIIIKE